MKKLLCTAIAVACLDANGMMVVYNQEDFAIRRSDEKTTLTKSTEQSIEQFENLEETPLDQLSTRQLLTMVNLRELGEPLIIKDKV
ncbi:MAG: hypothetical protein LBD81_00885, partial [Holosporaceae bacterium]|nr:hypothetical protein [Holosporaceae bacterium]